MLFLPWCCGGNFAALERTEGELQLLLNLCQSLIGGLWDKGSHKGCPEKPGRPVKDEGPFEAHGCVHVVELVGDDEFSQVADQIDGSYNKTLKGSSPSDFEHAGVNLNQTIIKV